MRVYSVLLVLGISACSHVAEPPLNSPDKTHNVTIPEHWEAQTLNYPSKPSEFWGVTLPEQVTEMLNVAAVNNPQLRISALKTQQSLLDIKASSGLSWPDLKVLVSQRHSQTINSQDIKTSSQRSSLGLNATWEIDLWQKLANATEATRLSFYAKQHNLAALALSIQSQVLTSWLNVIEQNNLFKLNKKNIANQNRRLQMSILRLDNGLATSIDIRNAKTSLMRLLDTQQLIQSRKDNALRKLQVVLGRYPSAKMIEATELPEVPDFNFYSTPSNILLNRPDVLSAESKLIASGYAWKVAEKKKLPKLSLTLNYDVKRDKVSELFDMDYWLHAISASLVQPIFYRGVLSAQAEKAKLQQDIELVNYQSVLLNAWQEVENALQNDVALQKRQDLLNRALYQAQSAERQTENQYTQGLATSFELLAAQRTRTSVETDAVKIAIARVKNRIQLTLALGIPISANQLLEPSHVKK